MGACPGARSTQLVLEWSGGVTDNPDQISSPLTAAPWTTGMQPLLALQDSAVTSESALHFILLSL